MLSRWSILEGVGLPQGPNASRLLGNFYLQPVDEIMLARGYNYFRYMDDIRIVARSKPEAVAAIREFEGLCRERGLSCSSHKTQVMDETEYAQHLDTAQLDEAAYQFQFSTEASRAMLRRIFDQALSPAGVDKTRARFSIWRLTRMREYRVMSKVFKHMENLAPLASVVAAYLRPFIDRATVQRKVESFLKDRDRSYSPYLRAWIYAAMLESREIPESWADIARADSHDLNTPSYMRGIAACVLGKRGLPRDIAWLKDRLSLEHDPLVLRANMVALRHAGALDKRSVKIVADRQPGLERTGIWLMRQNGFLPSLVDVGGKIPVA